MSLPPFGYQDKLLLSQYAVRDMLLLALRRGGKSHQLLAGSRIFEADLAKPQHRIEASGWLVFLRNCQQLQSPELPLLTAAALLQNPQLPLCQMIQHAANLRQALGAAWYFRQQLAPYLFARLQQDEQHIRIELRAGIGLGAQQRLVCELWFGFILQLLQQQHGLDGVSLNDAGPVRYRWRPSKVYGLFLCCINKPPPGSKSHAATGNNLLCWLVRNCIGKQGKFAGSKINYCTNDAVCWNFVNGKFAGPYQRY